MFISRTLVFRFCIIWIWVSTWKFSTENFPHCGHHNGKGLVLRAHENNIPDGSGIGGPQLMNIKDRLIDIIRSILNDNMNTMALSLLALTYDTIMLWPQPFLWYAIIICNHHWDFFNSSHNIDINMFPGFQLGRWQVSRPPNSFIWRKKRRQICTCLPSLYIQSLPPLPSMKSCSSKTSQLQLFLLSWIEIIIQP